MIEMDLSCLARILCAASERESTAFHNEDDIVAENEYLLYDIILPAMDDPSFSLSAIDFEAFELEDIRAAAYFAGHRGMSIPLVCGMAELAGRAQAKAASVRSFC